MLTIRLFRVGKKNQPSFKIVVTDKRRPPKAGRFTEEVGFYNPRTKEKGFKPERIKYWLSVGAQPSQTIYNLLVSEKIIEGKGGEFLKKIPVHKKSKKPAVAAPATPAPVATASAPAPASVPEKSAEVPIETPKEVKVE